MISQVGVSTIYKCLSEPESGLRRISVNCVNQIVRHSEELARKVVSSEERILTRLSQCLGESEDLLLRRQSLVCLANIAKHKRTLAEKVIDRVDLNKVLQMLNHEDLIMKVGLYGLYRVLRLQGEYWRV